VKRLITPGRLAAAGLVLLAAVALILWVTPSSSYLILPDRAKPLAERVDAPGEQRDDDGGGIYYVDVIVRKASLLEEKFGLFRPDGAELVPEHAIVPPGTNFGDRRRQNLRQMDRSQQVATAVALRELGYDVKAKPEGSLVVAVADDAPAAGEIEPTDVIVAVDGKPVTTTADLAEAVARHQPGDRVTLRVVHRGDVQVTLGTAPENVS
jgi:Lon-like protease